jgi:heme-degrading monooxygenase HmoA
MSEFAKTPKPPYYAVIFTARRTPNDNGYAKTAGQMRALAQQQSGYLGLESAGEDFEITISYWTDLDAIAAWKRNVDHAEAQRRGRTTWYSDLRVRICKVEHEY